MEGTGNKRGETYKESTSSSDKTRGRYSLVNGCYLFFLYHLDMLVARLTSLVQVSNPFSTNSLYRAHWTKAPYILGLDPKL